MPRINYTATNLHHEVNHWCQVRDTPLNCKLTGWMDVWYLHSGKLYNIAMENELFEDVFPLENGDIPASYVRNHQRVGGLRRLEWNSL